MSHCTLFFSFGIAVAIPCAVIAEITHPSNQVIRYAENTMLPIVSATVGNLRDATFLIDSGTSHSVIDVKYVDALGEITGELVTRTASGNSTFPTYAGQDIVIGQTVVRAHDPFLVADLGRSADTLGFRIDGIVGDDIFQNRMVQFNFDNRTVVCGTKWTVDIVGAISLPIRSNSPGLSEVDIKLKSHSPHPFLVDTGSQNTLTVNRRLLETLDRNNQLRCYRTIKVTSAIRQEERQTCRVENISFRGLTHGNMSVVRGASNLLGVKYLSRYIVTFDVPNKKIYFQKGKKFNAPETFDRSGLRLAFLNEHIEVENVESHSPSEQAGIEVGDWIEAIGKKKLTGPDICWLREQLRDRKTRQCVRFISRSAETEKRSPKQ